MTEPSADELNATVIKKARLHSMSLRNDGFYPALTIEPTEEMVDKAKVPAEPTGEQFVIEATDAEGLLRVPHPLGPFTSREVQAWLDARPIRGSYSISPFRHAHKTSQPTREEEQRG